MIARSAEPREAVTQALPLQALRALQALSCSAAVPPISFNNNSSLRCFAEPKKQFYKRFLYEPFPVESSLPDCLPDHLNAEIVGGTVASRQDAVDYLTWTFFFRRLLQNPSYYDMEGTDAEILNAYMSDLVEDTLGALAAAGCVELEDEDEGGAVAPLALGRIAAFYYLRYRTAELFAKSLGPDMDVR